MATKRKIKRATKRSSGHKSILSFLPEKTQAFLARRFLDGVALLFAGTGLFIALSLFSYDHGDPSWNTASAQITNGSIINWGGKNGAWLSDFLLQTIGGAAFALSLGLTIWGIRIYRREILSPLWLRTSALLTGTLLTAIALANMSSFGIVPQETFGGSLGELILQKIKTSFASFNLLFISLAAGGLGIAAFLYGFPVRKYELAACFKTLKNIALLTALFIVSSIAAFNAWIRHHNSPEDRPEPFKPFFDALKSALHNARNFKPEIPTRPTSTRQAPAAEQKDPAPPHTVTTTTKISGSIPVVTPQQANQSSSASTQARFNLADGDWELPSMTLIQDPPAEILDARPSEDSLRKNAQMLQNVLADFNVEGEIVSIHPGPVVTLYELEPAPGIKTSRIISLSDDIARSMSAVSVRCAVIPGRNVIGIELPNSKRQTVYMQDLLGSRQYAKTSAKLPLILGKDISGQPILADLSKMPHLLVAGTTGSGKSVGINTMIMSLLYCMPPEKCRFIMIDPKMLELSIYDDIPHLLSPVVTEPGKAVVALKWTVQEMEERYRAMSKLGVRNIEGYNARLKEAKKNDEILTRKVQTGFDPESGKPVYEEQPMDMNEIPYIVVIVDEFADLMLVAGKDVENAIQRLAQMARAAGIHLIMATQRPSVDVITGVIKANFPTRISFQVTSKVDSRTILGEGGAEQLLGMGDMLYMASGGRITRVHGPFVSDKDVESVTDYLRSQGDPAYISDVIDENGDFSASEVMGAIFGDRESGGDKVDELYDQAVALVAREGKASTSFVQRHLQIGYNRAARIIEEMEKQGVISPATATGKRTVLVRDHSDA